MLMLYVTKKKMVFHFYKIKILSLFREPLNLLTMWIASKQLHKFSTLKSKVSYHSWHNYDVHLTNRQGKRATFVFSPNIFSIQYIWISINVYAVFFIRFLTIVFYMWARHWSKLFFYAFHILFCPQNFYWK